jgi:hypothetical protein
MLSGNEQYISPSFLGFTGQRVLTSASHEFQSITGYYDYDQGRQKDRSSWIVRCALVPGLRFLGHPDEMESTNNPRLWKTLRSGAFITTEHEAVDRNNRNYPQTALHMILRQYFAKEGNCGRGGTLLFRENEREPWQPFMLSIYTEDGTMNALLDVKGTGTPLGKFIPVNDPRLDLNYTIGGIRREQAEKEHAALITSFENHPLAAAGITPRPGWYGIDAQGRYQLARIVPPWTIRPSWTGRPELDRLGMMVNNLAAGMAMEFGRYAGFPDKGLILQNHTTENFILVPPVPGANYSSKLFPIATDLGDSTPLSELVGEGQEQFRQLILNSLLILAYSAYQKKGYPIFPMIAYGVALGINEVNPNANLPKSQKAFSGIDTIEALTDFTCEALTDIHDI